MLLQPFAAHVEMNNKLSRMKSQHTAVATMLGHPKAVAYACKRPTNCAKRTRSCKELSATLLTAEFLALVTKRDDLKNLCETLTMENQCIPGLAAEAKRCWKKLPGRGRVGATVKISP